MSYTPVVGMGVTEIWYSDRKACTIVEVSKSGKSFKYQWDKATRADDLGMSDTQKYTYSPDTDSPICTATLRSDGKFKKSSSNMALVEGRHHHHDYSF
jgi:hypothetical protein